MSLDNIQKWKWNCNCTNENLADATAIAKAEGHITISMIQRRLRVSYNHGTAILVRMIQTGVIEPEADPNTFQYRLKGGEK